MLAFKVPSTGKQTSVKYSKAALRRSIKLLSKGKSSRYCEVNKTNTT